VYSLLAFSLILLVVGLLTLARGELVIRRRTSAAAPQGTLAYVIGAIWAVIGAETLCVALGSGTAVRLAQQLPDDLRFLVGITRGLSQLTVIVGIIVFLITMVAILLIPGNQGREEQ
jgi:hypothetical protein